MRLDIQGAAQYRALARQFAAEGRKGLGPQLRRHLQAADREIEASIDRSAEATMPSRGGYRGVYTRSQRHKASIRATAHTAVLTITTFADGRSQRRDIRRLNEGQLRHPVYGRSRRLRRGRRAGTAIPNPWATTAIRPGFWTRPTAQAGPVIEKGFGRALDELTQRLAKG